MIVVADDDMLDEFVELEWSLIFCFWIGYLVYFNVL